MARSPLLAAARQVAAFLPAEFDRRFLFQYAYLALRDCRLRAPQVDAAAYLDALHGQLELNEVPSLLPTPDRALAIATIIARGMDFAWFAPAALPAR